MSEFFQTFKKEKILIFKQTLPENGKTFSTLYQTNTTMTPKPDKLITRKENQNYSPIVIMNMDINIFFFKHLY